MGRTETGRQLDSSAEMLDRLGAAFEQRAGEPDAVERFRIVRVLPNRACVFAMGPFDLISGQQSGGQALARRRVGRISLQRGAVSFGGFGATTEASFDDAQTVGPAQRLWVQGERSLIENGRRLVLLVGLQQHRQPSVQVRIAWRLLHGVLQGAGALRRRGRE